MCVWFLLYIHRVFDAMCCFIYLFILVEMNIETVDFVLNFDW